MIALGGCALAMTGCQLLYPLNQPAGAVSDAAAGDVPSADAPPELCTGLGTVCFEAGGATSEIECTLSPAIPPIACPVAPLFRLCDCGAGSETGGVVLLEDPAAPDMTDVVFVGNPAVPGNSITIMLDDLDATCAAGIPCQIDSAVCAGGTQTIWTWKLPFPAGEMHQLRIWEVPKEGTCIGTPLLDISVAR